MTFKTGTIYKIIHNQSDLVYVGSTFNTITYRWRDHKYDYKKYLNGKKTGTSIYPYFKEYGIENFSIIKIKEYKVADRKGLLAMEQLWISKLKCVNKQNTFGILRKEKEKERHKEYYENNKDKINEIHKEYRENNKDKDKERNKAYRENNKDMINEKAKQYYENNKDKINERRKEKVVCPQCNLGFHKNSLNRHIRTIHG